MIRLGLLSFLLAGRRYEIWEREAGAGITIVFEDTLTIEDRRKIERLLQVFHRFIGGEWTVMFREDLNHLGPVLNSFEADRDPKLLGLVFFFQYPKTEEEIQAQSEVYEFRVNGKNPTDPKSSLFIQENFRWDIYEVLRSGWRLPSVMDRLQEIEKNIELALDQGIPLDRVLMRDLKRVQAHFKEQKSFLFGKKTGDGVS